MASNPAEITMGTTGPEPLFAPDLSDAGEGAAPSSVKETESAGAFITQF